MAFSKLSSDHKPLVFTFSLYQVDGPRSFKFSSLWTSHESFISEVEAFWLNPIQQVCPIKAFIWKLRGRRDVLRKWNWSIFGDVNLVVERSHQELLAFQEEIDNYGYTNAREEAAKVIKF